MNQNYPNGPSAGGAVTAEEFAAALIQEDDSCNSARMSCCGQDVSTPAPAPVVEEGCCCKKSFRAALQLLQSDALTDLLDFDAAAFITDHYSAGVRLEATISDDTPTDNLANDPTGTFRRFSPCNCDLLEITAPLYSLPSASTGVTVTEVSLCELIAVVLGVDDDISDCSCSQEENRARNFRRLSRIISRCLTNGGSDENGCHCPRNCDDCCCAAGLLSTLSESNLSRRVSLVAGPLILSGVTLLGSMGNVLVLANDEDYRIYFVCVNSIEFLF